MKKYFLFNNLFWFLCSVAAYLVAMYFYYHFQERYVSTSILLQKLFGYLLLLTPVLVITLFQQRKMYWYLRSEICDDLPYTSNDWSIIEAPKLLVSDLLLAIRQEGYQVTYYNSTSGIIKFVIRPRLFSFGNACVLCVKDNIVEYQILSLNNYKHTKSSQVSEKLETLVTLNSDFF